VLKGTTSKVIIENFTVPCLHATQASAVAVTVAPTETNSASPKSALPLKSRPSGPKIGFPPKLIPELFKLIHGNTNIKPDLVAQLRREFDESITSKAAIEAKVKEVAVREGRTKDSQWKVRQDAWVC
jgi:hypothetical protein